MGWTFFPLLLVSRTDSISTSLCQSLHHWLLFIQPTPDTSPTSTNESRALERIETDANIISRFAPGILVKFGSDYDAEGSRTDGFLFAHHAFNLHHAPFTNPVVVNPWEWRKSAWYFFVEECPGVPLAPRHSQ